MKLVNPTSSKTINKLLKKSHDTPIAVQFYANWCGPCRTLKPVMQDLAKRAGGQWKFSMVDVESYRNVAAQYRIASIPTVHLFYKGKSIASFTGSKSAATIQNWLKTNLPKGKKETKKNQSNRYAGAEQSLKQGNIPLAIIQLLSILQQDYPEDSGVKILLALQFLGTNNPQAMQLLNQLDTKGDLKAIAKQLQSLIEMDVDERDEHTPTSSPYNPMPRDANAKIDIANLDKQFLAQLVHHGINQVRTQQGIRALEDNSILTAAAKDQNAYQMKHDVLSHTQNNSHKRTVKDRVDSFGGGFRTVGENVQYQGMQVMNWGRQKEVVTDTYLNTAKRLVDNWLNSRGHYKNLINNKFSYVGTAIGWNSENNAIFATQVFGG